MGIATMPKHSASAPVDSPTSPGPWAWQLRLLGAVEARRGERQITHWPSRAAVVLLARLAMAPARAHAREELVELLWPGVALDVGRNRLRQALSTLKHQLETGDSPQPVIQADRSTIRLLPGRLTCDALDFEQLSRSGATAAALERYGGELMPGFYDEWVLEARARLATLFERLEARPSPTAPSPVLINALPCTWTRLFGIEHSATRLLALVRQERLVTVLGPGGCGKTRLAIEAARALQAPADWAPESSLGNTRFVRIVFVSLANCVDTPQALDTIAKALNVSARDPLQGLKSALADHASLLVLDNFEQLTGSSGGLVMALLEALPQLHLLLTSRRRLGLDGEQAFVLGGLPLPAVETPAQQVALNPALALFVDRARAVRPDFQPADRDWPTLSALVRLLDGMPLALELAASRLRGCTPAELLQRLQASTATPLLDLLSRAGDDPSGPGHHASLRHVMQWSWQQLKPPQAALLQTMTVLAAPARFETVAAAAGMPLARAQDLLQDLIDASLVQAREDRHGVTRHSLLQPVRELVAEAFPAVQAAAARSRVQAWLIERGPALVLAGPVAFEADLGHVHAGITSAVADGQLVTAARIAVAVKRYWTIDAQEAMPLLVMQALDRAAAGTPDRCLHSELCELLAYVRMVSGFGREALRHAEQARDCACDDRQRSLALSRLVWTHLLTGKYEPADDELMEQAVALGRQSGGGVAEAVALRMQMMVGVNVHLDFSGVEPQLVQAQRLWEQLGDPRNARRRALDRATCWAWTGRNADAATALALCETEALQDDDIQTAATSAWQLGRVMIRRRRWADADAAFKRCLRLGWQRSNAYLQISALLHLPDAWVMLGHADDAARLQGFATAYWQTHYGTINRIQAGELRRTRRLVRLALGGARAEALRVGGCGLSLADATSLGLAGPQPGGP